jgi:DNA-binding transcriptional ArsR family regulator
MNLEKDGGLKVYNQKLNDDEKLILKILERAKRLPGKEIYKIFTQISKNQIGYRAFRNHLRKLCSKGLVRSMGKKRWRTYAILIQKGSDEEKIDDHLPEWIKTLMGAYIEHYEKRKRVLKLFVF